MLTAEIHPERIPDAQGGAFAIVAARYNARYVDSLLRAACSCFKKAKATKVEVVRVPGSFEIPAMVARLTQKAPAPSAVLAMGIIFRGDTTHAEHIGQAVSFALARIQVDTGVPIVHGVYLFENKEQAEIRCINPKHNRGNELARTALWMRKAVQEVDGMSF